MQSRCYPRALFLGACLCLLLQPPVAATKATSASLPETPPAQSSSSASLAPAVITIPGPLRSFLRMAAISQKASPDEILPFLARSVFVNGYRRGEPTEYLNLLQGYLNQAREL